MAANPIWIAAYGKAVAGAAPVWIAPGDGSVPSAAASWIAGYGGPVAGASPVWIAGYGGPVTGATPITLVGFGGSGGSGGGTTSVWSAADASANGMTLSNGGLTVTPSGVAGNQTVRGSIGRNSGKLYVEFKNAVTATNSAMMAGLADATFSATNQYLGQNGVSVGVQFAGAAYVIGGFTSLTPSAQPSPLANDVLAIAVDLTAGKAWISINNVWIASGNPATGASPFITMVGPALTGPLFPGMTFYGAGQGVWTLQVTAASQKYAPPSGFTAWDGGTGLSPSDAYLLRTVGGNEGGNGANIKTLIDGLVADGVWSKLDALYVLAQQNATDALLNLVGTSYSISPSTATFTAYKGYSAFPTVGIDTGFNASSSPSPHFVQNSASIGGWSYGTPVGPTTNQTISIGNNVGANAAVVITNYQGAAYGEINASDTTVTVAPPGAGLLTADRSSASAVNLYFNGASIASGTPASTGVETDNIHIGGVVGGFSYTSTISAAFIGASLGSAGQLALYNRLNTYMTAVAPSSVWSAADATANAMTLSNGGLTFAPGPAGVWQSIRTTTSKTTGKLYVEFLNTVVPTSNIVGWGLASSGFNPVGYLGQTNFSGGMHATGFNFASTGFTDLGPFIPAVTPTAGDVWMMAVDFSAGYVWVGRNNIWANAANPATGTMALLSFVLATTGPLFAGMSAQNTGGTWTLQATAASQKYAPPSGFSAWDGGVAPPPTSVWSASDATANGMTLSNGGLTATYTGAPSVYRPLRGSVSHNAGKVYIEFLAIATGTADKYGLASSSINTSVQLGNSNYSCQVEYASTDVSAGFTSNYTTSLWANAGDVVMFAVDFTAGSVWIGFRGTWVNSSNPGTGTLPIISFVPATVGALFPAMAFGNTNDSFTLQATAASQTYTPPAGFTPWG